MTCCVNGADTVPLDSLLRHVATLVPQLPYGVALDKVRERYIEFARKTNLIVGFQELPIQREVTNYCLEAPEGYEVFAVRATGYPNTWTWYGPDVNYWYRGWGTRFYVRDNSEIIFDTQPSNSEPGRCLLLTLIPAPCCDSLPASVATPYGRGIAYGAVADALLMPNKGWTNPNLSAVYETKFNRTVLSAKNLAITNRGAHTPKLLPVRVL